MGRRLRIAIWHVHGSWTTAFVHGRHEYVVPVLPDRGPDGRGRARTWDWPDSVRELPPERLSDEPVDLVVLQRPHELPLARDWFGRWPGRDLPAIYLEHNTPGGQVPFSRHPLADQSRIPVVHVTHFNRLFWDCGSARTEVVEHGIVDPGYRYDGELPHAAVVLNDPVRRGRAVGADLLPDLSRAVPTDVFGMNVDQVPGRWPFPPGRLRTYQDLPQHRLYDELVRRRVYVHTARWTSLGLSLLEAMFLGMPVVALDTTEVSRAVPAGAGVLTNAPEELYEAVRGLAHDREAARLAGRRAREAAVVRYGLKRFHADWDVLLEELTDAG